MDMTILRWVMWEEGERMRERRGKQGAAAKKAKVQEGG